MFLTEEGYAASDIAQGSASPDAPLELAGGALEREVSGMGKQDQPLVMPRPPPVSVDAWKDRNDFLRVCVSFGLTAPQIGALSLSTPQPMSAHQQVYRKINEQGLDRLYVSKRTKKRRLGDHNRKLITVFMRLCGQAFESGNEVSDVFRDQVPFDGERFRPDLGLKIGKRQFYVEIQLSKIEYTRWSAKIKNYVRLYLKLKQPFRVLFLLESDAAVTKVRQYAREMLKDRPALNLFYFMTLSNFERAWEVVKDPVWIGVRDSRAKHSLM